MAVLVFLLLFVVLPLTEIYVFVQVSQEIGFGYALLLVVAISFVGVWLVKHEGLRVWARFNQQIAAGQVPAKEVVDGVLLLLAGVLLLLPGFISDAFAVLLIFPPTRALVRRLLLRRKLRNPPIIVTYGPGSTTPRVLPGDVIDVQEHQEEDTDG